MDKLSPNLRISALLSVALFLSACGRTPPLESTGELVVVDGSSLPTPYGELAPPGVEGEFSARPYLVGPFDKLIIDVFGIEGLQAREVQVDASGRASFPLIGSFEAAGKTPTQIEDAIEIALRERFIRNPQVTVNLEETVSQIVTIDGQVIKPGLYPVIGNMSLMQGIATSGGVTEFAKLDDVVVFRETQGQRYAALYNLGAIRRGLYRDPDIYAGDIVIVGDSSARRMFRDILAASPLLTTPIIALMQNN
ncbi:polysaccharide biosynthesis/export family protein [Qipengyuania sp. DY56-A-20]|uniref:Polysaccharide biosynthesis/export family protein n=1 Tax=Qipengyuania benthica TaxID=3067651 RepID=A0ABT9HB76_9SPHN|nr:polysaccharide biosynthesis/export family protein [Qipengyuania sp. DY56-A-20]MDP4540586.1 polysaccharide biosynthesis/export family protein [Qipengyuania sp. DY56-A-20]